MTIVFEFLWQLVSARFPEACAQLLYVLMLLWGPAGAARVVVKAPSGCTL